MKPQSHPRPLVLIPPLLALLLVSGCGEPIPVQTFPPAVDVAAVTEKKPLPTPDIVTDAAANERYNAAVELWGDRVRAAGVRICKWAKDMGMKPKPVCD